MSPLAEGSNFTLYNKCEEVLNGDKEFIKLKYFSNPVSQIPTISYTLNPCPTPISFSRLVAMFLHAN